MGRVGYKFGPMSDEHKQKIREATKGIKKPSLIGNQHAKGHKSVNAFEKGHIPWCKGKKRLDISGELHHNWKSKIKKRCVICEKEFELPPYDAKRFTCCSPECSEKLRQSRRTGTYKKCLNCQKSVYIPKHYIGRKKYCSLKCKLEHFGKRPDIIEKLRKSHLGKIPGNKGKKYPQYSGANSPNWNGGSSFEPYGLEFNKELKAKIRARDNHECQLCGLKENGKSHIPHHINYDKRDNREENLILLCGSHHSQTNYNRQYWINIFKRIETISLCEP